MLRTLTALVVVLAAWPATAVAADRTIATQTRPTELKAQGGIAIYSAWDGAAYSLALSRDGGVPQVLPVAAQAEPFDADIGTDARGRPAVIFSHCVRGTCGLYLLRLDAGAPVKTSIHLDSREPVHPTLWRGRVAWVAANGHVVTRNLSAPASTRPKSLPPAPRSAQVLALELSGSRLAVSSVSYKVDGGVCGWRELRLVDVRTGRGRTLGSHLCGLNGQSWFGPTFDGHWLYFARTCNGEGGCGASRYGVYRYDLRTRKYALAGDGRAVEGWAYGGARRAYSLRLGTFDCSEADPCSVVWSTGLRFKPARAPVSPVAATATANERLITSAERAGTIDAYGGVAIMALGTENAYSLFVSRDGGAPEPVALGAGPQPIFDGDVGPDANGRPTVVYSMCDPAGCGLWRLRLDGTSKPARIPGITLAAAGKAHPTLWRGRLAWVDGSGQILTRRLSAGASTRVKAPRYVEIDDLELSGRNLALTTTRNLGPDSDGYCGVRELWLLKVGSRETTRLGHRECRPGRGFLGPSFDGDSLYFAYACDDERCSEYGSYRYNLRTRKYAIADDGGSVGSGWAYAGKRSAYLVRTAPACCRVVLRDALAFRSTPPPIPRALRDR